MDNDALPSSLREAEIAHLTAERNEARAQLMRLKAAFRINILRYTSRSHAEIDAELERIAKDPANG